MPEPGPQVFAAYAHIGVVSQLFAKSLMNFLVWDQDKKRVVGGIADVWALAVLPEGRNELVRTFLTTPLPWFLSLDTDIVFEPKHVYQLLEAADPLKRPIVGGLYVGVGLNGKLTNTWRATADDGSLKASNAKTGNGIREVAAIGMGFSLIHRSVFEALGDDPFSSDPDFKAGEDVIFCRRARAAGFTVHGHGGCVIGHEKPTVLMP